MQTAWLDRFSIDMTQGDTEACSHPGPCDDDVEALEQDEYIRKQLDAIPVDDIRAELQEYGAWDDTQLADDEENRIRILWIAAGNICDEIV